MFSNMDDQYSSGVTFVKVLLNCLPYVRTKLYSTTNLFSFVRFEMAIYRKLFVSGPSVRIAKFRQLRKPIKISLYHFSPVCHIINILHNTLTRRHWKDCFTLRKVVFDYTKWRRENSLNLSLRVGKSHFAIEPK